VARRSGRPPGVHRCATDAAVALARGLDGGLDDERARRRVTSSRSEPCTRV
jgi:hypothetical protein